MDSNYFQPNFYHFSQDSTLLAKAVVKMMPELLENSWCLDLGSGCGVVGFEIIQRYNKKLNFDFLEIQKEFEEFFYLNLNHFGNKKSNCTFHNSDFRNFNPGKKYSLIVSNPPYFERGKGIYSSDQRKNKCRFFTDGSLRELLIFYKSFLTTDGKGFFLLRRQVGNKTLLTEFFNYFKFSIHNLDKKTDLVMVCLLDKK